MPPAKKPPQVYVHGSTWYCRFSAAGRQHFKPLGATAHLTRQAAEQAAAKVAAQTLAQFMRAHQQRYAATPLARFSRRIENKSDSHQILCAGFEARLIEYFGRERDLLTITQEDVEAWRDWLAACPRKDKRPGTLSAKTVKEHIDWLAAVFNLSGLTNPCRGVERPTRTHAERVDALEFFSPDEMQRLFEVCAGAHPTYYNGFIVYAYTGCRAAEIQGLRPEHRDTANKIIWVTGKGGKRRPLRLTGPCQPAWDALEREMSERPREDGYIFPQYATWPRKMMDSLCADAFGEVRTPTDRLYRGKRIYKVTPNRPGHPHMLRHTFASMALLHWRPAWDIAVLAKWLGHADIGITYRTYCHWIAAAPPSGYDQHSANQSGFKTDIRQPAKKAG